MNPHKYFASAELISNPLCGISTYKDVLNLATGQVARTIKKLVLTGEETLSFYGASGTRVGFYFIKSDAISNGRTTGICSHFKPQASPSGSTIDGITFGATDKNFYFTFSAQSVSVYNLIDITSIKTWLAAKYAAGTPVTIWYVLDESETEQITVPSGLSGTSEGYLIQDGTPTAEAPIYPTANTAKGWYNINAYKRSVLVWNADTAYERSDGSWT